MLSPSYTHTHTHTHTHINTNTHKCEHTPTHTQDDYRNLFQIFKIFELNTHFVYWLCFNCHLRNLCLCRGWENFFIKGQMVNDIGFVIYTISVSANLFPSYSVKAVTKGKKKAYINECVYVPIIVYWNLNFIIFMCYEIIFFFLKCLESI